MQHMIDERNPSPDEFDLEEAAQNKVSLVEYWQQCLEKLDLPQV